MNIIQYIDRHFCKLESRLSLSEIKQYSYTPTVNDHSLRTDIHLKELDYVDNLDKKQTDNHTGVRDEKHCAKYNLTYAKVSDVKDLNEAWNEGIKLSSQSNDKIDKFDNVNENISKMHTVVGSTVGTAENDYVSSDNASLEIESDSEWKDHTLLNKLGNDQKLESLTQMQIYPSNKISSDNKTQHNKPITINNQKFPRKISRYVDYIRKYGTIVYLTYEQAMKAIQLRKESKNYIKSPFKCETCYRGFGSQFTLNNHFSLKHDEKRGKYVCEYCNYRFCSRRNLREHITSNHAKKFTCNMCSYVCFDDWQAKIHVDNHKGKKYQCKLCNREFKYPNTLSGHMQNKHPKDNYPCDICGCTFNSLKAIQMHKQMHMTTDNEVVTGAIHKCEKCDMKFISEAEYQTHLIRSPNHSTCVIDNLGIGCKICAEMFPDEASFKAHKMLHYKPRLEDNIDSNETKHGTVVHSELESAEHKQPTVKKYVCEICDKKFKLKNLLQYHLNKHDNVRPYKCEMCDKTYANPSILYMHKNMKHTDLKTYKCQLCDRVYQSKNTLRKHNSKIHLGIRKHQCSMCDKKFVHPCEVRTHTKYVHMNVPWPKKNNSNQTKIQKKE